MDKQIPVLLLTGYLGSGKTTLLNRILRGEHGIRFAVIVNDIGEVNIDASLIERGGVVEQADDSLVPLQNGCVCCTLRTDLIDQLVGLARGDRFDYIVIEASGICEPEPIAQTLCTLPSLMPKNETLPIPTLDAIVTVVDALRLRDEFQGGLDLLAGNIGEEDIERLVIQQIEFCDMVLLNKASEVSPEELGRVEGVVKELNGRAKVMRCDYCDVPLPQLLHTGLFGYEATATAATWVRKLEGLDSEDKEGGDHDHEGEHNHEGHDHEGEHHGEHNHEGHDHEGESHHHHHHHHHGEGEAEEYGISTYVYQSRLPMSLSRFDHFVARRWPQGIIRAKGICYFEGEEETCYLFEQAGKQVSLTNAGQWYATMPEDELRPFLERNPSVRRDWDSEVGDRMQKLVFIGQHLDRDLIRSELDLCLTPRVSPTPAEG